MKKELVLEFEEIDFGAANQYTDGCSGGQSDCCTRVCTRPRHDNTDSSLEAWNEYFELEAGVIQY